MIAEVTADASEADRARAFALLPFMFGLGSVIGPVLGGFLADPVKNYPSVFGDLGWLTDFLTEYRYFLPSFMAASICFCGWIFGLLYLEETLIGKRPQDKKVIKDEEQRLLSDGEASYSTFRDGDSSASCSPTPTIKEIPRRLTFREAITPPVIAVSISFGLIALHGVFYDGKFCPVEYWYTDNVIWHLISVFYRTLFFMVIYFSNTWWNGIYFERDWSFTCYRRFYDYPCPTFHLAISSWKIWYSETVPVMFALLRSGRPCARLRSLSISCSKLWWRDRNKAVGLDWLGLLSDSQDYLLHHCIHSSHNSC